MVSDLEGVLNERCRLFLCFFPTDGLVSGLGFGEYGFRARNVVGALESGFWACLLGSTGFCDYFRGPNNYLYYFWGSPLYF